jgi:protein-tyrosine phosphatase
VTPFAISFVCTGNRFRSPLAEHVLRRSVDGLPVTIESLGTLDIGPGPPLPAAIAAAQRFGVDITSHQARVMTPGDLAETDLVLGFERMHVLVAVVDGMAVRDRSFTLPEFVELIQRLDPQPSNAIIAHARSLVRTAAALRPPDPQLLSVPELGDPFRRTAVEQDRIAEQIRDLVERLARLLFGAAG